MEQNSLNTLVKEMQTLKKEMELWQNSMVQYLNMISNKEQKWLTLSELIDYLPTKPAPATIYGWVSKKTIPYHKCGKRLSFLKSEIDEWVFKNGLNPAQNSEEEMLPDSEANDPVTV